MDPTFQRQALGREIYFNSIADSKFKHSRITVCFVLPLQEQWASNLAVLPAILTSGCQEIPSLSQLGRKLDELYGADLSGDVGRIGPNQLLMFTIRFLDERYTLHGEQMGQACAELLSQLLLHPKGDCSAMDEKDTALEKQSLLDSIDSLINDKRRYALMRCKEIMCQGEPAAQSKYGTRQQAMEITPQSARAAYNRMLSKARIEILFTGAGDAQQVRSVFEKVFEQVQRDPLSWETPLPKVQAEEKKEHTERMELSQSKLVLGFRTGGKQTGEDLIQAKMMCALLGASPLSRLFVHVREKLSLCYYCVARLENANGLLLVDCGIEEKNKEKAVGEILNQVAQLQQGDFTQQELEQTRLSMANGLRTVGDTLGSLETWYLTHLLEGHVISPQKELQAYEGVTAQQVAQAAQKLKLDTIYCLAGKEEADCGE